MKRRLLPFVFLLSILFTFALAFGASAQVFVKHDATGSNNGTSWQHAFTDLKAALNAAPAGSEIWVAAGTYKPDVPNGDPASTFLINENLHLLGGFDGTETSADQRDPAVNETILSGDLNGDDPDSTFAYRSDNVMNVMRINADITNETLIDGFTIQGGQADGTGATSQQWGGGIFCAGIPFIRQCVFKYNHANLNGGAINLHHSVAGEMVIEHCRFENNRADAGGGIHINPLQFTNGQSIQIKNSIFSKNVAVDDNGGGIKFLPRGNNGSFELTDCEFDENNAKFNGGGLFIVNIQSLNSLDIVIDGCHFSQNNVEVYNGGGFWAGLNAADMDFVLKNSTFENNSTGLYGTAVIYGSGDGIGGSTGTVTVDNCEFKNNSAGSVAGLDIGGPSSAGNIEYTVTNCHFIGNEALAECGALDLWAEAPTKFNVEKCYFEGNKAGSPAGAIWVYMNSPNASATLSNCILENNSSPFGAAVATYPFAVSSNNDSITFVNCLFTGNSGDGATIATTESGNVILLNCTVANNPAGGLLLDGNSSLAMQNTIFYNPDKAEYQSVSGSPDLFSLGGNLIRDNSMNGLLGTTDLENENPLFTEVAPHPFQLSQGSPAINKGIIPGNPPAFDLAGHDRIQEGAIDIGAYESPFPLAGREILADHQELKIAPNPASDLLRLRLETEQKGEFKLRLVNALGQTVYLGFLEKTGGTAGWDLNLQQLNSGIYNLIVSNSERMWVKQVAISNR